MKYIINITINGKGKKCGKFTDHSVVPPLGSTLHQLAINIEGEDNVFTSYIELRRLQIQHKYRESNREKIEILYKMVTGNNISVWKPLT